MTQIKPSPHTPLMNHFIKPKLSILVLQYVEQRVALHQYRGAKSHHFQKFLLKNLSESFSTCFRQSSYTNIQSIQSLPSYAATVTHQIQEAAQCRCPHSLLQLFSLPNKKQALEIKVEMIFITQIISDSKIGETHPSASTVSYFL